MVFSDGVNSALYDGVKKIPAVKIVASNNFRELVDALFRRKFKVSS